MRSTLFLRLLSTTISNYLMIIRYTPDQGMYLPVKIVCCIDNLLINLIEDKT